MQVDRRQFVLGVICGGSFSTLFGGCGSSMPSGGGSVSDSTTSSPKKDEVHTEVTLTFTETDEFYKSLTDAIDTKQNVVLKFDGEHRVGENSKLLAVLGNSTNWKELWKELQERDTATGRKELQRVFTADMLKHKALKDEPGIPSSGKLPNGEVIEPATVVLVLGILLILAAASVAHAEIARGGKYKIAIRESNNGMELLFQGEP